MSKRAGGASAGAALVAVASWAWDSLVIDRDYRRKRPFILGNVECRVVRRRRGPSSFARSQRASSPSATGADADLQNMTLPQISRPWPRTAALIAVIAAVTTLSPPAAAQSAIDTGTSGQATNAYGGNANAQGASTDPTGNGAANASANGAGNGVTTLQNGNSATPGTRPDAALPDRAAMAATSALVDPPGEFERYVQDQLGLPPAQMLRRFGHRLLVEPSAYGATAEPLPVVPGDYIVKAGDEIVLTLWGSVDATLRLTVDRAGMISVPRVGAIPVAGLRYDALTGAISRQVAQVFKNFQLSATMGQVRPMRVYVTGYATHPGSLNVRGLATVLQVVMQAGGPAQAGSFRDIHLRRQGKEIASFDLYDLLTRGERAADQLVQPEDIVHIGPVGAQVAISGSVNQPAIYEVKAGETLADLMGMAGGFSAVADRERLIVEPLSQRNTGHVTELHWPADGSFRPGPGDFVRVFSAVSVVAPLGNQNKHIHVEGEVRNPGDYVLRPDSSLQDAVKAAGGLSPLAFVYGAELYRTSVRHTQEANYDRAIRDLETDIARTAGTRRITSADEAAAATAQFNSNQQLLERLKQLRPTGRMVLPIDATTRQLPELALEDGDRLYIPSTPATVGVFGSVFSASNFIFAPQRTVADYLAFAGGPTRGADRDSIFVVRANGTVISAQQNTSFWGSGDKLLQASVLPGDSVFVPEEVNKSTFIQDAKDWTQILYQFGLGLAGIKSLGL